MEFGTNPFDDPAIWAAESGIGETEPKIYLSLRRELERSLELERLANGLHNDLANASKDKDHAPTGLHLNH